ncbi:hypothetical protein [Psychroflexus sp. MES1-P1E]|uniref:hypothetical protein n=1 Tax=Psychroflexus sp. MES1-P1E TaxID=2058320 RepID=UPI000C7A8452|nr:hypothetical protein [Psychroflexus sp. MES1-P1E]PKG43647.1 hypothetical protein CXF67_03915 [Psychroflexus sp. MES1-P1E]
MKILLFKPFEKYSEKTLLLIGVFFTLLGSFFAYVFNIRFDGIIDIHIVPNTFSYQALLDNLINIFCLVLFLYISTKYINKKTRLIDILNTALVARAPFYILPFFNINGVIKKASEDVIQFANPELISQISSSNLFIIIVFGIITILFLVWYISLLFNGFKVASNAKGKTPIILFVISLLLAEVLSKFLIVQLY